MTLDPGGPFVGHLLNALEDIELPLLSWGVTTGSLAEEEVLEAVEAALATHSDALALPASHVVQGLIDAGLIFPVPDSAPLHYRTRMAEALRLLTHLRQVFPSRGADLDGSPWWRRYRSLVADYRLHVAERRYPKREIPLDATLAELEQVPGWDAVAQATVTALVGELRLARFQVDATAAVLSGLSSGRNRGVVVGAGTGSGKTMAFYLPAFTAIRQHATQRPSGRVHTVALYPRTELLRDQLRDAVQNVAALDRDAAAAGRRRLRIGVLYGDTPQSRESLRQNAKTWYRNWEFQRDGVICPYLACPSCEQGKLKWADRNGGSDETLTCTSCRHRIPDGQLALTRDSLLKDPPDLLFTTTEMLNRSSTDPRLGKLLGWTGRGPELVLLDEVHTYSGTHGAQTGLVLRRWRHAVAAPMSFVGLSATLRDAGAFFAELVGLPFENVVHVEPRPADMEYEGREYAIAVRSDPVSGASVLSTSIQTAMLFGRVLEPDDRRRSPFGSTGFLFTDDLDVSNRFYNDLRDAEGGQNRWGASGRKPVLAGLRASDLPQRPVRYADGQSWDLVERIGHVLGRDPGSTRALPVGRTTSQDTGVDARAALIVATAALEVGFNDARVGLVLQHKAPHDTAAFVQRRGRAGRKRGTRPITVVVLSEYGRDRLTYQAYDALFAPEIAARALPVTNRHVLKIQATQSLFDWVARSFHQRFPRSDLRKLLQAPGSSVRRDQHAVQQWEWVAGRLEELLTDAARQDDLARHLKAALQLDDAAVQALLWEQPRSLLLAVVPTVLRRLKSEWRPLRADPGAVAGRFLPEFVTSTLFEPLNLPEVVLDLPFETDQDEHLPIGKALREAVPGRVSLRYGYQRDDHRTWLPLPGAGEHTIEVQTIAPDAPVAGQWRPWGEGDESYCVLRPTRITLSAPPPEVKNSSQGYPRWASQVVLSAHGLVDAQAPTSSPLSGGARSVGFATHAAGNPVLMRRMTPGARSEVTTTAGGERRTISYTHEGAPAAMGFELDVDGLRLRIAHLDPADPRVREHLRSPQWRALAFHRAVTEDPQLAEDTNHFQRTWLALIYLTTFALAGTDSAAGPEQLWNGLRDGSWRNRLPEVLAVLYRSDEPTNGQPAATDRLLTGLTELSHDRTVVEALNRAGELLFADDVDERTWGLARRAYMDTFAAAVLDAVFRVCRNASEQDLVVDVVPGSPEDEEATIWLTETAVGGVGVVEHLAESYAEDSARFWSLVLGALRPNDFERTDVALTRLVEHVTAEPNGRAASAIADIRAAGSTQDTDRALHDLLAAWSDLDGPVSRASMAALSVRMLRPGSTRQTDRAAAALLGAWSALEQRLGVEVDARVLAYAVGSGRLSVGAPGPALDADQIFSLLWPRGAQVRNQHLANYQPYVPHDRPSVYDRLLLAAAFEEDLPVISLDSPDWQARYRVELPRSGALWLSCAAGDRSALGRAMARIPALAVDADVLRVYGTVTQVVRHGADFHMRVELRGVGG